MPEQIGYTSSFCRKCDKHTAHRLFKGEGCVVKICVPCLMKARSMVQEHENVRTKEPEK